MRTEFAESGDAPVKAKIATTVKAICPACSEGEFIIDHKSGRYGPWGCSSCGARWIFDINGTDVAMTRMAVSNTLAWLVVSIGAADPPVYAVIDSPLYAHSAVETQEGRLQHARYWVEESTCPTNLIRVDALVTDGDTDPHGLLTFVGQVPQSDFAFDGNGVPEGGWMVVIEAALRQAAGRAAPRWSKERDRERLATYRDLPARRGIPSSR